MCLLGSCYSRTDRAQMNLRKYREEMETARIYLMGQEALPIPDIELMNITIMDTIA